MIVVALVAAVQVIRRSRQLLDEMGLNCDDRRRAELREAMDTMAAAPAAWVMGISLLAGLLHAGFLLTAEQTLVTSIIGSLGTLLVWVVVTHVAVAFIFNARLFAQIGERYLQIDLHRPATVKPLGRAALLPVLGLVATQALYPLLWVGGQINLGAILPGFLVTTAAMIFLFLRQVLPLHRRMAHLKRMAIDEIESRIARADQSAPDETLSALNDLLQYRDYLMRVSEWPFQMGTLARWSLYLLIPPLTWVGAALIEIGVDQVVG